MDYISIASGSSGNCHFIEKNNTAVLIDAGITGKATLESLKQHDIDTKKIKAIFVTHEHNDHIKGVGIVSRKLDLPIYATEKTWEKMSSKIGNVKDKNIRIIENKSVVGIGDIEIASVPVKHDAADPVAYKLTDNNKTISILTDLGIVTQEVFDFICKTNSIVLESNHDINMLEAGPYPYELKRRVKSNFGHLSNESAGKLSKDLVRLGTTKIMLAHLSRQNNIPVLAYQSVVSILNEHGIKAGNDLELIVLEQFISSARICV